MLLECFMRTSWKFGLILRISIQTFLHKIILTICFFTSKYNSFRDWLLIHRPNQFDQMAEFFTSATSFSEKVSVSQIQLRECKHSFIFVVNYPAAEITVCVHDHAYCDY